MLSKLSSHFYAWAKGWLILALFATLIAFVAITLPSAQAASGNIVGLDTRSFYTPEEAFSTVASYSDEGRANLRIFYLTADIVNPLLYTLVLSLLISWLFQRGFKPESKMQKLNVFPVGAAIFDLLENLCIVTMLTVYPSRPVSVAWLSTVGTLAKYFFIYVSFLLVLIGLVRAALNKFQKQS